ncbi:MAG TPA: hypothetical protein VHZ29_11030 [Rhizomicrobium sp.]|nr:hypothetical protein [Rhizomicrobium sp.]
MRRAFLVVVIAACAAWPAIAAPDVTTIVAARTAVERGDWKAALDPLARLAAASPQNGEWRLSLARARYLTGDIAGAEADYRAAFDLKSEDIAVLAYGIAKCDAQLGRRAEAMTWLRRAITLGYRRLEDARSDDVFASFRGDAEYRALVGLVDVAKLSRDEGWRSDIRMLADWVGRKSFHPYRTGTSDRILSGASLTQAEFEAAVAKLIADVPKLGDRDIEVALFRLVAGLGDGHTALLGSHTRIEYALTLPLAFYVFDDGLYVVSAAPDHRDLIGSKVIAIDLTVMQDGKRRVVHLAADPTQPDIWNALPKPAGWTWIGDSSKADYQQGNDKPFWWKWEPADAILYVQYNKVADGQAQTLAAFAGELGAAIAKYPVGKLVIDMRNNNGGDTYLNEGLLGAVVNSKVNRAGRLYVIIGRRTFSAAMNAVSYFGRFTKAVFVGEPTGGKPNAPGDETPFTPPYSGIVVNLSDRYWQASWPDDFSDWRAPDLAVPVTLADFASGHDAAMELIRAQPALPD